MLFGRNNQQGQAPQPGSAAGAAGPEGAGGTNPGSSWTGAGYPTQPAGTGYAGYTPGAGPQGMSRAYAQNGYASQGAAPAGGGYPGYPQAGQGYGPAAGASQAQGYASGAQGYASGAQGYAPGQSGYAQPQPGYAPGQTGYAQAPSGAAPGQPGYAPGQGGYAQPAQGYAQGQGYAQSAQGGYAYPQMNQQAFGAQGGYPQGQGGYTQGQTGYAQGQTGYAQGGYNPYAQMGRNQPPQGYQSQIPLNGGGYVPPAVPVKRQPFVMKSWMLIAAGVLLLGLFGAGMFLPGAQMLLWVFIALAAASVAVLFVRPLVSANQRLCFTIIFAVLSLLALVKGVGLLEPREDQTRTGGQTAAATVQPAGSRPAGGTIIDPETGEVISTTVQTAAPPTAAPAEDNSTAERLETFFRYWGANRQDEMLTLCAPSWQSSVDNPKTALFGLMANRTPLDYTVEKISGVNEDTSRTVTVTSTMDRNNGKEPVKYRLNVLMVREGDQWFVDPQSLKTYEEAETPDPALAATPTPSPEPLVNSSTVLYYNPDGGSMYHADQNCKSVHAKYLPLKGHFTYGEVSSGDYAKLSPCNVCAAPLRP